MAKESRKSKRINKTAFPSQRKGKSKLKAIRKTNARASAVRTHTLNIDFDWCVIQNVSDVDIKFNFKSDNMTTDFWTLKPGEMTPAFGVSSGVDINYQAVSGNGKQFEMICWA